MCQEEGAPQESVLNVSIFTVSINDILDVVDAGISTSLYVDDLAIWFSGSHLSALKDASN